VPPEPYMQFWRKVLFVVFAVVSYVYRWVVTFVILKFMATFLKPYKLEVISQMLAAGALASMLGWPAYRLIMNLRKRGRLPDMKPFRVASSVAVVVALLLVVFLVPVPISRIKETGLVQVHPMYIAQVHVEVPGQLKKLYVYEGQAVQKEQILAEFASPDLESRRVQATSELEISEKTIQRCAERINEEIDPQEKNRQRDLRAEAEGDFKKAQSKLAQVNE